MDPNATLKAIRKLIQCYSQATKDPDPDAFHELLNLIEALDEWITKGGFLPIEWARYWQIRNP